MKIVYSEPGIQEQVEQFGHLWDADIELRETLKEEIEDFKKRNSGLAIGSAPIPKAFIDLGGLLLAFFLGAMVNGLAGDTYALVKNGIKKLVLGVREKASKQYNHFLVSNGVDPRDFERNIYFYIPIDIDDAELETALDRIPAIVSQIRELQRHAQIDGSLRFYYSDSTFVLKELMRSE